MDIIRSRQNALVKKLVKLANHRRTRLELGETLLIGTHLVAAARDAQWPLQQLLLREGSENKPEIADLLASVHAPVTLLASELFDAIEQLPSSSGLLALADIATTPSPSMRGFCLLLDRVQDPGNVGSILRSAAAAGVDQVWLSTGCADAWSPKVIRAAMGAHFFLPLIERIDSEAALAAFDGALAITTLDRATSLYQTDLTGNVVLALGAEGSGVSSDLAEHASLRLHIPMQPGIESLNVAAAAAICLFERRRQLG